MIKPGPDSLLPGRRFNCTRRHHHPFATPVNSCSSTFFSATRESRPQMLLNRWGELLAEQGIVGCRIRIRPPGGQDQRGRLCDTPAGLHKQEGPAALPSPRDLVHQSLLALKQRCCYLLPGLAGLDRTNAERPHHLIVLVLNNVAVPDELTSRIELCPHAGHLAG